MKLNFSYKKYWYWGRKSLSINVSGWDSHPQIYLNVNGGESEVTFHISFFIGIWIAFTKFWPRYWFPDYRCSDSEVILGAGERQIGISFHGWDFWWIIWMNPWEWNSKDPWYRHGNTHFTRWVLGKHTVDWKELESRVFILPFLEGNYNVRIVKKARTDRWQRWFTKKSIAWEAVPDVPVPHEGKGENSYDLDEDGTYSLHFGERKEVRTLYEAALYFWKSQMETREKRGGASWRPKKFRDKPLEIIKENPTT